MVQKLLGLLLLAGAGFLAWNALNEHSVSPTASKKEAPKNLSFSEFVSNDLLSLKSEGHLPKEWDEIQHVSYLMHSAFQRELIGKNKIAAIPETPAGRYKMEIEFIDVPDDENPGLILQMSMMDVQTNNKVWELGRTYPLKSFLKAEPKEQKNPAPASGTPDESATTKPSSNTKSDTKPENVPTEKPSVEGQKK